MIRTGVRTVARDASCGETERSVSVADSISARYVMCRSPENARHAELTLASLDCDPDLGACDGVVTQHETRPDHCGPPQPRGGQRRG